MGVTGFEMDIPKGVTPLDHNENSHTICTLFYWLSVAVKTTRPRRLSIDGRFSRFSNVFRGAPLWVTQYSPHVGFRKNLGWKMSQHKENNRMSKPKPPRPTKPPDREEPPPPYRPPGKRKWLKGHWKWQRKQQQWVWTKGHWSG